MGLADRDWYREDPPPAWNELYGAAAAPASSVPRRAVRLLLVAVTTSVALMALLVVTGQIEDLRPGARGGGVTPAVLPTAPAASNRVVIRPTGAAITPAATDSVWTLRDRRFGRLTVRVPAGQVPLDVMAAALAREGYRVVVPGPSAPASA